MREKETESDDEAIRVGCSHTESCMHLLDNTWVYFEGIVKGLGLATSGVTEYRADTNYISEREFNHWYIPQISGLRVLVALLLRGYKFER